MSLFDRDGAHITTELFCWALSSESTLTSDVRRQGAWCNGDDSHLTVCSTASSPVPRAAHIAAGSSSSHYGYSPAAAPAPASVGAVGKRKSADPPARSTSAAGRPGTSERRYAARASVALGRAVRGRCLPTFWWAFFSNNRGDHRPDGTRTTVNLVQMLRSFE